MCATFELLLLINVQGPTLEQCSELSLGCIVCLELSIKDDWKKRSNVENLELSFFKFLPPNSFHSPLEGQLTLQMFNTRW